MVITRGIEVPKEMKDLSCGALVAGIVEAVMDGAGFVSPRSLADQACLATLVVSKFVADASVRSRSLHE